MLQESMKNESHGLLQVADMQIWYKKQFLNLVWKQFSRSTSPESFIPLGTCNVVL